MLRIFASFAFAALISASPARAETYRLSYEDMGAPVSIVDLGRKLIGKSGREIDIVFTGLRPGEKLREQLMDEYEAPAPTALAGVFRIMPRADDAYLTAADVAHLEIVARTMGNAAVRQRVFACLDQRLNRKERAAG
jgi:FlaA1/EpsC-like NDP-sugar epimerase